MNIEPTPYFKKAFKRLLKKYRSLTADMDVLIESLEHNPFQGVQLRKGVYKIRMSVMRKEKEKAAARELSHS